VPTDRFVIVAYPKITTASCRPHGRSAGL